MHTGMAVRERRYNPGLVTADALMAVHAAAGAVALRRSGRLSRQRRTPRGPRRHRLQRRDAGDDASPNEGRNGRQPPVLDRRPQPVHDHRCRVEDRDVAVARAQPQLRRAGSDPSSHSAWRAGRPGPPHPVTISTGTATAAGSNPHGAASATSSSISPSGELGAGALASSPSALPRARQRRPVGRDEAALVELLGLGVAGARLATRNGRA